MESNEHTELTSKTEMDSQRADDIQWWGKLGSGGIGQKGKRTHGHGQQCRDCWWQGGIRGVNGNRKNTIKIK